MTLVVDKTCTLTEDWPTAERAVPVDGRDEDDLTRIDASAMNFHPVSVVENAPPLRALRP